MGVSEALVKLAERHAAERAVLRVMSRRYDQVVAAAGKARAALALAEAERRAVLAEWVASPGWSAERVAECVGATLREIVDAVRAEAAGGSREPPNASGAAPLLSVPARTASTADAVAGLRDPRVVRSPGGADTGRGV